MVSLSSEGQNLPANQISSTYLNPRLSYNYFRFGQTNVRHIGILLPLAILSWPDYSNLRAVLHHAIKFRPNRVTRGGIMTSYTISKWWPRQFSTTSGFVLVVVTVFWRSNSTWYPNFIKIEQQCSANTLPVILIGPLLSNKCMHVCMYSRLCKMWSGHKTYTLCAC